MAEQLQPGVRQTLATLREVGIRQVMVVGGDKHLALAAARRCGLLPSSDWGDAGSGLAAAEAGHFRPLGESEKCHCCPLIQDSGEVARNESCNENDWEAPHNKTQHARISPSCRKCRIGSRGGLPGCRRAFCSIEEMRSVSSCLWNPGSLHGLLTNAPASLAHWAVADAQKLLHRCSVELTYLALKNRRRHQRSPSSSLWTCECGAAVTRDSMVKAKPRQRPPPFAEGRRTRTFTSQSSWDRLTSCARREKERNVYLKNNLKRQLAPGATPARHRSPGLIGRDDGVNLSALPLRRKLRVGRCFLRVFQDIWQHARAQGQGICLLLDAASLAFFFSHKLLQVRFWLCFVLDFSPAASKAGHREV